MNFKISKIVSVISLAGILFLSSCMGTYTVKNTRTASFFPDEVRFDMTADDIELVGEMDISTSFSRYLGIFKVERLINDMEVPRRTVNSVSLYGTGNLPLDPMLRRALYDAHVNFPEADFLIPVSVIEENEKLFMGRHTRKTAHIKAYKLKI